MLQSSTNQSEEETLKSKRDKKSAKCPYCYTFQVVDCKENLELKNLLKVDLKTNCFSGLRNRKVKAIIDGLKNKKNPLVKQIIDEELSTFFEDDRLNIPNLYWLANSDMYDRVEKRLDELPKVVETEGTSTPAKEAKYVPPTNDKNRMITVSVEVDDDDWMWSFNLDTDFVNINVFNQALKREFRGGDLSKY